MSYEFSQSVSEDLAKLCKKHGLDDCMIIGKRGEGDSLFLLRVYYNKESPTLTIIQEEIVRQMEINEYHEGTRKK